MKYFNEILDRLIKTQSQNEVLESQKEVLYVRNIALEEINKDLRNELTFLKMKDK
jgi:hypothetical protein